MVTIEYNSLVLDESHMPDFVASVSQHHYGKKINLKENYATGDFKILAFPNGCYAHVSNYIVNEDFKIDLSITQDDFVALHINQVQAGPVFTITLNDITTSYDDKIVNAIFLTGGSDHFTVSGTKGACINRLKLMIPKSWLAGNIKSYNEKLLQTYFSMQEERLYIDSMDNTYRSMVDKVMHTEDNAFYLSIAENIAAVITERFFNRLGIKMLKNQQLH